LYNTLPFAVRWDDAYLVWLTICCLRTMPNDVVRATSVRMAFCWFASILLGNMVGMATGPGYIRRAVFAEVGKASYILMLVFCIRCTVRDSRQVRRLLIGLSLAAMCGITIGVIQVFSPGLVSIFETPSAEVGRLTLSEKDLDTEETVVRAAGSVGTVFLAVMSMSLALLGMRMILNLSRLREKAYAAVAAGFGAIGCGYTVTRGAILGMLTAICFSTLFMRKRPATIAILIVGAVIVTTQTDVVARVMERVVGGGGSQSTTVERGADTRIAIWFRFLSEFSPHYFLFGRGFTAEFVRVRAAAHSSYIGALSYTGLFGICVLLWVWIKAFAMSRHLQRIDNDGMFLAIAEAAMLIEIALCVNGFTAELWQKPLLTFFTMVALMDMRKQQIDDYWASLGWSATPHPRGPSLIRGVEYAAGSR
jgi:hypothetical protein